MLCQKQLVTSKCKKFTKKVNDSVRMLGRSRELFDKIKRNKTLIDHNGSFKAKNIVKVQIEIKLANNVLILL